MLAASSSYTAPAALQRKRVLLDSPSPPRKTRLIDSFPVARLPGECARFITTDSIKGKRALILSLTSTFWIGRSPLCDYTINHPSTSSKHCRIYAFEADTGDILVCLEDVSTNGTMHNDRRVHKSTVVLCDGDKVDISGQVLRFSQPRRDTASQSQSTGSSKTERIGDYLVFDRKIGSGAFSVVHLALNVKTLKQVACKKILRKKMIGENVSTVQREVAILKNLSHPNINKVEDVVISDLNVSIFLQLVSGGDLFGYLIKQGTLSGAESKWILFQLLLGLEYLHTEKNIAHRDLKLENVILAGHGPFPKVLLADFGQARFASDAFSSLKGTITYMAPEQLTFWTRRGGYDGKRADCWSLGIILAMLLAGCHPFEAWLTESQLSLESQGATATALSMFGETAREDFENNSKDLHTCRSVVEGELMLPEYMKFGSEDGLARSLISHLLTPDPVQRATARQALESEWIVSSQAELEMLYKRIVGA